VLIVHPHFHRRRTGVTGHVEAVVGAMGQAARAMGFALLAGTPRIGWRELVRRARGSERVIWHAHRNVELLVGLVLRRFCPRLKLAFTRHSSRAPSLPTRLLARRADLRVALTSEAAAAFGLEARVVGHGVDLSRFRPPEDRPAAWKALGLPGARGVGVIGRIRPPKGQGDFAAAVAPLLRSHSGWSAVLVGQAKRGDAGFARALRGQGLLLAGPQRDVVPWYRGLTVVVQPSLEEAFSLVPLEAMASGCCVVASALPYARQVIDHGRTGFLYPPGDVGALRAVLDHLLADPSAAERAGAAAALEARSRLGVDREAAALMEAYRSLGGGDGRAGGDGEG
jgi:mannosyltransferase